MAKKDELIVDVEEWLNENYTNHPQFDYVEPTGRPGNTIVGRLIMALQIELGITNPVPTFGPSTARKFQPLSRDQFDEEVRSNLVYILQGAFWAKGYSPGTFDGKFNPQTENAIHRFQSDVGFKNTTGTVDAKLMKALLNTDGFQLARGERLDYRIIQQVLNTEYADGYFDYIPTNGVYERKTNKALIYALQIESGLAGVANGNYGPSTIASTPTLRPGNSQIALNRILKFGLVVNGAYGLVLNGDYDGDTEREVREFQAFMTLPITGVADMPTIKQLLTSNGYIGRTATACDASMIIDSATASTLKRYNYEVIGRYLTGNVGYPNSRPKGMTHEELAILEEKGIRVFPIYQDGGYYNEYFDDDQGKIDAKIAYDKANELGFPDGTTIYFAVDYDAYDYQVTDRILPYMREIRAYFNQLKDDPNMPTYKFGIYGPRNICIRCANDSSIRTDNSFVSNMSTGFSGNLGFPMPKNWAFSQFYETSIGEGSGYLEIDKNDYSGRDSGASSFAPNKVASRSELEKAAFAEWEALAEKTPFLSNRYFVISPQFEFKQKYRLIETNIYRVEVEASVGYEPPAKLEGLTFNVMNGQLEASVETVLGIGASVLSSAGLSLVKNQLQSIAAGVDNGQIVVSLEVENNEILCHLDLVKEEIETDKGKVNILARITVALKLNPFSEAQIDQLLELTTSYQYVVALIIVVGLVTIASPGIPGIIAFISSMFIGFA